MPLTFVKRDFLIIKFKFMPKGIHTNPDCKCCFCKAKRGEYSREKNYRWKGGKYQDKIGRWWIRVDGIKYRRYRYVAKQCLNRELVKEECIHHINEDKSDDRPENLYLFSTQAEHTIFHHLKIKPILISNITAS